MSTKVFKGADGMIRLGMNKVRARPVTSIAVGVLVVAPLLLIPASPISPVFVWSAGPESLTVATLAAIFGIVAYSLGLLMRLAGLASIAHGALFGVGAYAAGTAFEDFGVGFWPGLLFAILAATAVGLVVGALALRTVGMAFLIITIALGSLVVIVMENWVDLTGGPLGMFVTGSREPIPGLNMSEDAIVRYYVCIAALYVVIGLFWSVVRSQVGKRLVAIRDNETLARSLGINSFGYKLGLFCLSAGIAGVAGHLYVIHLQAITPELFGVVPFIFVFLMVIMGGVGSLAGPAIGAWLVTFLPFWFDPLGLDDPTRQEFMFGVLLVMFMLFAPHGIAGSVPEILGRAANWVERAGLGVRGGRLGRAMNLGSGSEEDAERLSTSEDRSAEDGTSTEVSLAAVSALDHGSQGDYVLQVEGVTKSFRGVRAVAGVSLEAGRGEILGIIGPNGSGKTTLVNCISGFARPSSGRVMWNERDITKMRPDAIARLGLVRTFQQPMLFPSYTAREHCELFASPNNGGPRELVPALLAFAGLDGPGSDIPAGALPYGHRRSLGLALALARRPSLLMLDEPGAGLTDHEMGGLRTRLSALREQGITILVIDHDMAFLMPLCDRMIVLDAGEAICEGAPQTIREDPQVIAAYLGEKFAERHRGVDSPEG